MSRHPDDVDPVPEDEGREPLRCECGRQLRVCWVVEYVDAPLFDDGVLEHDLKRSYVKEHTASNVSRGCPCGRMYFVGVTSWDDDTYVATGFKRGKRIKSPSSNWKGGDGRWDDDRAS